MQREPSLRGLESNAVPHCPGSSPQPGLLGGVVSLASPEEGFQALRVHSREQWVSS